MRAYLFTGIAGACDVQLDQSCVGASLTLHIPKAASIKSAQAQGFRDVLGTECPRDIEAIVSYRKEHSYTLYGRVTHAISAATLAFPKGPVGYSGPPATAGPYRKPARVALMASCRDAGSDARWGIS